MENLIDIHSHILPGVDDGADSLAMSMRMLKIAADDGISKIVLTPHNKPGHRHIHFSEMASRVEELQEIVTEENIEIELYIGSELYYRSGLSEEIDNGISATLAGSRYVLLEFTPLEDFDYIRNGCYALLTGGYYPVLAHVERYQNVFSKKSGIGELIETGCYIQVNAGSIMGKNGAKAKRTVKELLKRRQVHFIATDAHDLKRRMPHLSDCADYVKKKYGKDYGEKIFCENPLCVIRDKDIALY